MSAREAQECVDRLMEYDRKLAEPFSRDELKQISEQTCLGRDDRIFTDDEKQILKEFGWQEKKASPGRCMLFGDDPSKPLDPYDLESKRRVQKMRSVKAPDFSDARRCFGLSFSSMWNSSGRIYVWLDNCNYCESKYKGFYYVRYQLSMLDGGTTAYAHPELVVEKKKLRPDQVEYMERKCQETLAAGERLNRKLEEAE